MFYNRIDYYFTYEIRQQTAASCVAVSLGSDTVSLRGFPPPPNSLDVSYHYCVLRSYKWHSTWSPNSVMLCSANFLYLKLRIGVVYSYFKEAGYLSMAWTAIESGFEFWYGQDCFSFFLTVSMLNITFSPQPWCQRVRDVKLPPSL